MLELIEEPASVIGGPCRCPEHNPSCRRAGRPMSVRDWELCSGHNCTPEQSEKYRRLWDSPSAREIGTTCPHLWKRVRNEDGSIVTRETPTTCCGTKPLDLFECRHEARKDADNANDHVTLNDCHQCPYKPKHVPQSARAFVLTNNLCPGDVLSLTAAVYSLHRQHPGKFITAVRTTSMQLWENNPDIVSEEEAKAMGAEEVQAHYHLINQSNQRAVHFLQGYCDHFEENFKVRVPLLTNRPMLYLSRREREWLPQVQEITGKPIPYWVVNAGTKKDYTAKQWPFYQEVVDRLQGRVLFVQVGKSEHVHPKLRGVIDLIDRTDDRQLVRLVYHSQGVLCGTTFLMHLAAALEKPAVILAGGREPRNWNTYPRQHLISTVGQLDCCREPCWRSRTVALGDGGEQDKSLCERPSLTEPVSPRCMALISPDEVCAAILRCGA